MGIGCTSEDKTSHATVHVPSPCPQSFFCPPPLSLIAYPSPYLTPSFSLTSLTSCPAW